MKLLVALDDLMLILVVLVLEARAAAGPTP
jgi:hypothetical protein